MRTLAALRKKPGLSNAYRYPGETTLGPHGTYPVTKDGKPSKSRIQAAMRLAGHLNPGAEKTLKRKLKSFIQHKEIEMKGSLGARLQSAIAKKRRKKSHRDIETRDGVRHDHGSHYGKGKGDESMITLIMLTF